MYCITILVAQAFAELRSSYSNINGSHVYHYFELNCPPYTQYSSPKLGRSTIITCTHFVVFYIQG